MDACRTAWDGTLTSSVWPTVVVIINERSQCSAQSSLYYRPETLYRPDAIIGDRLEQATWKREYLLVRSGSLCVTNRGRPRYLGIVDVAVHSHRSYLHSTRQTRQLRAINPLKPNASTCYTCHTTFNFWHSGTLALSPERQSAQMSEIKTGTLGLYGAEHSKCYYMTKLGFKGLMTRSITMVTSHNHSGCTYIELQVDKWLVSVVGLS